MKKLENWIIKINDKDHYDEVVKVLNDFGYNTEQCEYHEYFGYGFFYCYEDVVCYDYCHFYNLKTYTLEEFMKAHNNFKNMKFKTNSDEETINLQKYLFSLGYKWDFYGKNLTFCCERYFYTDDNGFLHLSSGYGAVTSCKDVPEYEIVKKISYELKEVPSIKITCNNCGKEIDTNMKNYFKFNNGSYLCWDCFKEVEHACFPF